MVSSKKHRNFQSFESFWKPYVRVYQVFCVSHYSIYHSNPRIGRFIYYLLFFVMHSLFMVYTLITIYYLGSSRYKATPLMSIVSFISITGDFVEHAVAHLEPLFTRKQEEEIYRQFQEINTIFATKLNHFVDFEALRKKQNYTIGFFILSAIQAFGLSYFTLPTGAFNITLYSFCRAASIVIIRVRRFQSAIIINLLCNILMDVKTLLKQLQENHRHNSCENIRYLRDIYSRAYLIKKLLSGCFGWSFITFLMDYCFDFVNSSYWAYITVNFFESPVKILRKIKIECN